MQPWLHEAVARVVLTHMRAGRPAWDHRLAKNNVASGTSGTVAQWAKQGCYPSEPIFVPTRWGLQRTKVLCNHDARAGSGGRLCRL